MLCGYKMDSFGGHGLSCNKSIGRYPRHEEINSIFSKALSTAGISAIVKPPGISRKDGKWTDGLTLFPWKQGKSLIWDATCVDTLAKSYLNFSATTAGTAADRAEALKIRKYALLCDRYVFMPLGFETIGAWGSHAVKFIHDLGRKIKIRTLEPRSTSYLFQRISIAIQRGNTASIMGVVPATKSLD